MKGIYSLKIGEKFYIGKDFYIHLNKKKKKYIESYGKEFLMKTNRNLQRPSKAHKLTCGSE